MKFLAGFAEHDLIEFCEMNFEHPKGWIDVDFSQVGPMPAEEEVAEGEEAIIDWSQRPVLKCMVLQVRILENHQNGKDTHLRGLQIFARDEGAEEVMERSRGAGANEVKLAERPKQSKSGAQGLKKASWMQEPELR